MDAYVTDLAETYSVHLSFHEYCGDSRMFYEILTSDELEQHSELKCKCGDFGITRKCRYAATFIDAILRTATPAIFAGCLHDIDIEIDQTAKLGFYSILCVGDYFIWTRYFNDLGCLMEKFGFEEKCQKIYNLKLAANPNAPRISHEKMLLTTRLWNIKYIPRYPRRLPVTTKLFNIMTY